MTSSWHWWLKKIMTAKKKPEDLKTRGVESTYSAEIADAILTELMCGRSLRSVCADEGMPHIATVMRWRLKYPEFREQYAHACKERTAYHAEEILDIADDGLNDTYVDHKTGETRTDMDVIARSKIRIDARKWLMSKMNSKDFGDKITQETTLTVKGDSDDPLSAIYAGLHDTNTHTEGSDSTDSV